MSEPWSPSPQAYRQPTRAEKSPSELAPPVIAYRPSDQRNPERFPYVASIASAPTADTNGVGIRLRNVPDSGYDLFVDRVQVMSLFATRDWYVNLDGDLPFPIPGNLATNPRFSPILGARPIATVLFSTALTAITFGAMNGIAEGGTLVYAVTEEDEFTVRPGGFFDIVVGLMSGGPAPPVAATDFIIINLLWTESPVTL